MPGRLYAVGVGPGDPELLTLKAARLIRSAPVIASSAAAATPLVRHEDVLTVLPGTLPTPELARRLADSDGAVILKLGRTFPAVVEALRVAGRLDEARYVERASTGTEVV